MSAPPTTHVGRYELVGPLGSGAMGVVYRAWDPELNRQVAIKLVRIEVATPEVRTRLLREAQAMARVKSASVVAVHDAGTWENQIFLAMELIEGPTLAGWLEKERSVDEILTMFACAGRGLAAAHAVGLVHRDFKPQNVLIGADGGARVTDFGLVQAALTLDSQPAGRGSAFAPETSPLQLTEPGFVVGTPLYMSPEQFASGPLDARSDQFSFCVALYHALYRETPFPSASFSDLRAAVRRGEVNPAPAQSRVPPWLRALLLRGLSVDPAGRFDSVPALLEALEGGRSLAAKLLERRRVRRRAFAFGVLTTAAVVGASLAPFWRGFEERSAGLVSAARPAAWPDGVLIAQFDQATVDEVGWPIPRATLGRLIDAVRSAGAAAIAVDGFFHIPGVDGSAGDARMAQALSRGKVVIAVPCTTDSSGEAAATGLETLGMPMGSTPAGSCERLLPPVEPLRQVSQVGQVEAANTRWGLVRGVYLFQEGGARRLPALALATYAAAQTSQNADLIQEPGGVRVGSIFVPVEADGSTLVRFRMPYVESMVSVGALVKGLSAGEPAELAPDLAATIKGRFVIFGQTAEGLHDHGLFATGVRLPQVLLHGMQLADLVENRPMRAVPHGLELVISALLGGLLAAAGAMLRRPLALAGVALSMLGVLGGALLGVEAGWLLSPLTPAAAALAACVTALAVRGSA